MPQIDPVTTKPAAIGGGAKKVLYTLNTVRQMGVRKSAKALKSHNTCKACGLGMGGVNGGMVNELGEFPSVCNKSVQAQSSDIQPAIPTEIFAHPLEELAQLSEREMDRLGRLDTPLFKEADSDRHRPVSWEWALDYAAEKLKKTDPKRSFFYASGRSSNEAGFLLQLFARAFGTNNVNNCSYYCHQATSEGLSATIGSGTATVELADLGGSDLIFVIGANPSSNHPRFIHALKKCRDRGGKVIVINPAKEPGLVKFAIPKSPKSLVKGGDEIASIYLQPNIGSDIALFKGIAKAVLANGGENSAFLSQYTDGFETFERDIEATTWEEITHETGLSQTDIENVAAHYSAAKNAIFAWGMGMTHHLHGTDNVKSIVNLCLLRGMIGRPHAGLLPLRGHSNVQGIGTIGVKPVLPDDVFDALEKQLDVRLPKTKGMDTIACLNEADKGNMDAAVLMGGNLFGASPNSAFAARALDKIGFKIYLTTTLNRGHVIGMDTSQALILPVKARDEENQPTTQESMFNFVRLSEGGIKRLSQTRPESDILCDLADRTLGDIKLDFLKLKSHHSVRQAIAATVPGMEQLADIDVAKREFHVTNRLKHTPHFNMTDGKAHFVPVKVPVAPKRSKTDFTLCTMRSEGQFNTIVYEEKDTYRGAQTRWCVFMNKTDIRRLGMKPGDTVDVQTDIGEMEKVTTIAFDVPEGNAMAYFPEANSLIGTDVDPISKTPAFKSVAVRITPHITHGTA